MSRRRSARVHRAAACALAGLACTPRVDPPNVLVVVLDDVGVDSVGTWGEHPDAPPTPTIDRLVEHGVLFRNAWATPVCAPSRAALLTGRHGRRTGIGGTTSPTSGTFGLPLEEVTIPEALALGGVAYTSVATGKWHLGVEAVGGARHPLLQGFDHFSGSIGNLTRGHATDGAAQGYYDWEKDVDGTVERTTQWAPSASVDDALAAIERAEGRWLAYVALHAAHAPYEPPPAELLDEPVTEDDDVVARYRAIVRAADRELGRLLDAVDLAATTVVLLGDNGTPAEATTPPFDAALAKKTLGEGGIGVPFVIAGVGVGAPGGEASVPVHVTDVLPTLVELAGVDPGLLPALDGASLVPWLADPDAPATRDAVYSEWFVPDGFTVPYLHWQGAVRDERYKLATDASGRELLYDLGDHALETVDLLGRDAPPLDDDAQAALDRLRSAFARTDEALGGR